jgi:hypothetical protein
LNTRSWPKDGPENAAISKIVEINGSFVFLIVIPLERCTA